MLKIKARYKIKDDPEDNTYVCHGIDETSSRAWLGVDEPEYDGYNGDLIISTTKDTQILMSDDRCSLSGMIILVPVK